VNLVNVVNFAWTLSNESVIFSLLRSLEKLISKEEESLYQRFPGCGHEPWTEVHNVHNVHWGIEEPSAFG
jgi:hypothetical protein